MVTVDENLRMIVYMARHDPAVIAGFALIAFSGMLLFRIQMKFSQVGRPYMLFRSLDAAVEYFKISKQYGWAQWPVYCFWFCLPLGIASLVFGLFRL
jgi:hypothetical protein